MKSYLDAAATVPMRKEALQAYLETAESAFGNTQSLHDAGTEASNYLDACRRIWGRLLNVRADGFYFTGSASEGNQLAIRSLLKGRPDHCKTILTTKLEHASVLGVLHELEKEGYKIRYLPVDETGILEMETYEQAVSEETALVVMQLVNSEMGAIQDVAGCAKFAKRYGVPLHSDMVQGLGKLPVDLEESGVASAVFSAHKVGGPKSVGIVYLDPGLHWQPVIDGTVHQNGFRAGTLDVPGIVAATIAAKHAVAEQPENLRNAEKLQALLFGILPASILSAGDRSTKSPFIQGLLLPHVEGQWMMLECNRHQVAISTGTACKIGAGEAMSAMLAMGVESDAARKFIRISFFRETREAEIRRFVDVVETTLLETGKKI
ncbi:IscS subfamily cysteine desulfurase [Planococcus salinarum]|uniref:IscS subfamily cysteine desulfurase n=1 Tax=Planococcus salinarum TaxID=622695 RepID=UPI000E3B91A3|nr:IscS subfamily cysteine desulfurase [Planococcus salinarum]TAA72767.1 aminotransferase class V-fold PLP-dependent enzyme [Planococcus salinarum]